MSIAGLEVVGFGRETTWGTSVTPATLLPVTAKQFTEPTVTMLDEYVRGIRAKDFGSYQGVRHPEISLEGGFFPNECGMFLMMMMGTASGAPTGAGPYTHTFTLGNTAHSLTVQTQDGIQTQYATGMRMSEMRLNINPGESLLTYSANMAGKALTVNSSAGSISADATLGTSPVTGLLEGWRTDVTAGGSALDSLISCELTLTNDLDIVYTADNVQTPSAIYINRLAVSARLTIDYNASGASTILGYVRGKTQNALVLTITKGASTSTQTLTITMTKFDWQDADYEIDMGGIAPRLNISGRGLYNSTDAGPVKFVLINSKSTAY